MVYFTDAARTKPNNIYTNSAQNPYYFGWAALLDFIGGGTLAYDGEIVSPLHGGTAFVLFCNTTVLMSLIPLSMAQSQNSIPKSAMSAWENLCKLQCKQQQQQRPTCNNTQTWRLSAILPSNWRIVWRCRTVRRRYQFHHSQWPRCQRCRRREELR